MNEIIKQILNPVTHEREKAKRPPGKWRNKWRQKKLIGYREYYDGEVHPSYEIAETKAFEFMYENAERWADGSMQWLDAHPVEE